MSHSANETGDRPQPTRPRPTLRADPYGSLVAGTPRHDGAGHEIVDPSTAEVIGSWVEATDRDVDDVLAEARRVHESGVWCGVAPVRRAEVLEAAAERIRRDARHLAEIEALDTGKAVGGAVVYDLHEAASAFAHGAALARDLHGDARESAYPPALLPGGGPNVLTVRTREPVGVVVELLPWNGPLMTGSQRIATALAAGCTVVAKPPEQAVVSTLELAELLVDCGVPPGVVQVVLGPGETVGERLVADPRVDLVSLTGGVETGRRVMEVAAANLTPVQLELGGKSPVIVFADADPQLAVTWAMMAAFVNMGEVCVAGSRLLVEASVYDDIVRGVAEASAGLPIGDALDDDTFIGPLVDAGHAARVRGFLERAAAAGAGEVVGAGPVPSGLPDTFVAPTVVGSVRPDAELAQSEIFGPVLAAMSFDDEAEAVALANSTRYGLNASVFTADVSRALRMVRSLDVGEVNVNCHFAVDMNAGRGEPRRSSGFARTGIDAYSTLKAANLAY